MRLIAQMRGLMDDLIAARTPRAALKAILASPERRLYLGVVLVAIALALAIQ
jgi:hypothetical protein